MVLTIMDSLVTSETLSTTEATENTEKRDTKAKCSNDSVYSAVLSDSVVPCDAAIGHLFHIGSPLLFSYLPNLNPLPYNQ